MGSLFSCLGQNYGAPAEEWQVPSKWHDQQQGVIGIDATGRDFARPAYQHQDTPQRSGSPYQQQHIHPAPGAAADIQQATQQPAQTPDFLPRGLPDGTGEAVDEFPVKRHLLKAPVNWCRGELIGAGAFGRVYLGLNSDNGELMAVKQVLISKEEAVAGRVAQHVRELEKEVDVLKQLQHPNIVRYLGTDRSSDCLNIFLEYVPGGSIASLLSKFGSFKETVIKIYTRQILQGLQYLHAHKIMHRDIKGANILVDNTGLVKLADFGASKKIEDLVTIDSGVKSIKGTSYWMAPEVIKQTGHGRTADIWSVGCTIIEMATGKPPWSQFSSQVSAMFHIASSKGPPPIPDVLSPEGKDFLLLCFNRVPAERPNASRLLQHPFLAQVASVKHSHAAPFSNLATGGLPRKVHSPAKEGSAKPPKAGGGVAGGGEAPPARLSTGSSEFLKLFSPMADQMAEAAAQPRPASTTGERGRVALQPEVNAPKDLGNNDDEPMRQSIASHASARYEGVPEDDLFGSPSPSSQSDSDYNPVEEPSWMQNDSLQATHFALQSSPSDSPRILAFGVEESTAVASPVRLPQRQPLRPKQPGNGDLDDIMTFVKDKAQKDTVRLSMPFGPEKAAIQEQQGSKQQQWEAELEQELAQQRTQIRSWLPQ